MNDRRILRGDGRSVEESRRGTGDRAKRDRSRERWSKDASTAVQVRTYSSRVLVKQASRIDRRMGGGGAADGSEAGSRDERTNL